MVNEKTNKMDKLAEKIEYSYKDKNLLRTALTHSSFANEGKKHVKNNERLEFLGDSVLSLVVSDYLFKNSSLSEGELTKLRATIVCEQSLYGFAKELDLGSYLYLGKGEMQTGGAKRPSVLADAFEALIASIYLDSGIESARTFILKFIDSSKLSEKDDISGDYKTYLQEIIQKNPGEKLKYVLTEESGPDHDKKFLVEVHLNSNVIGKGCGKSKKSAEQMAAKEALELMGF